MIKIWLRIEKSVINVLIILGVKISKNKKPITKHVYENNTVKKTKRTLIIGRSGGGKTFLMLSLLKEKYPDDVYIICKTDNQCPSNYHNQSSEILPLEDYENKTIVFDDMLGSKEAEDIDVFFTRGRHQNLNFFTSLNHGMDYLKTLFEIIVVGLCCFHKY